VIAPRQISLEKWVSLYPAFCREFDVPVDLDFEELTENPVFSLRPPGFDWLIYCPRSFTADDAVRLCEAQFPVARSIVPGGFLLERPLDSTDLVLCQSLRVPDQEWIGQSSQDCTWSSADPFLDIRERHMLEAYYYWITKTVFKEGRHVDPFCWTRCPRSRELGFPDHVAGAYWDGEAYWVYDGYAFIRDERSGPRVAYPINLMGSVLPTQPK
jgi:hypothetical protein